MASVTRAAWARDGGAGLRYAAGVGLGGSATPSMSSESLLLSLSESLLSARSSGGSTSGAEGHPALEGKKNAPSGTARALGAQGLVMTHTEADSRRREWRAWVSRKGRGWVGVQAGVKGVRKEGVGKERRSCRIQERWDQPSESDSRGSAAAPGSQRRRRGQGGDVGWPAKWQQDPSVSGVSSVYRVQACSPAPMRLSDSHRLYPA